MRLCLLAILMTLSVAGTDLKAREIPVLSFPELEELISRENDTLYIYNFWATWCGPCVKELPAFEKITELYRNKKVKLVLVSLDFAEVLKTKVQPFVKKKKLKSEVVLLDPGRGGAWIDKVSTEWSGAIPATLFVYGKGSTRSLHEKQFTFDELNTLVQQILGM